MKDTIVIPPIKVRKLKTIARWMLEAATWLIGLGLLAASLAVSAFAGLVWLLWGSDTILALGLGGGLMLGLTGLWQLIRKLDSTVHHLRPVTEE